MFDSIDYIHTTDDNLNPDNTYDLNKFEKWFKYEILFHDM